MEGALKHSNLDCPEADPTASASGRGDNHRAPWRVAELRASMAIAGLAFER
jgi:hypothetical protein